MAPGCWLRLRRRFLGAQAAAKLGNGEAELQQAEGTRDAQGRRQPLFGFELGHTSRIEWSLVRRIEDLEVRPLQLGHVDRNSWALLLAQCREIVRQLEPQLAQARRLRWMLREVLASRLFPSCIHRR